MRTLSLVALMLLPITAQAARHELSFDHELQPDVPSDVVRFYGGANMDAYGIRGGYAIFRDKRRFGLVATAGWRRAIRSATLEGFDQDTFESSSGLRSALVSDTFSVGLKADVDVGNVWYPYVAARAELVRASSKLDSDTSDDDNLNQLSEQALAPAGTFVGGMEFMIPDKKLGWPVTAAIYVEAGYQVAGDLKFASRGDLSWGGTVIGMGIGLRM